MPRRPTITRLMPTLALVACGCALHACNAPGARSDAGTILDLVAPPTPAEAAAMAADPFNADKRQKGTLLLANAPFGGEGVYIRLYEVGLEDEDSGVQTVSIKALGIHGGPQHVAPIAEKLRTSTDTVLRWEATRALQRLHNPEDAVGALLEHLAIENETDADVRAACARALGQYAQPRVFDALVAALDDPSLHVNRNALDSLEVLTGERLDDEPRAWLAWADETDDLFAGRLEYEYPVFQRDRRLAEWIIPWLEPPNETQASPAGMTGEARRGGA